MNYVISLFKNLQEVLLVILLILLIYYIVAIGNKYIDRNKKLKIAKSKLVFLISLILLLTFLYHAMTRMNILRQTSRLIFYSLIFSYILNPIVNYLQKKGVRRSLAIILIYLFILAVFSIILFIIIPEISREFGRLMELIPSYTNDVYKLFNSYYSNYLKHIENLPPSLNGINHIFLENLTKLENHLLKSLKNSIESLVNGIANSFKLTIVPIIAFYFLKDKEIFKKKLCFLVPKKHRTSTIGLCRKIDSCLLKFLRGQIITSIVVGLLSTFSLWIIGIDFAILIGLIIALFEIVPYLGPLVGMGLTLIFGLLDSPSKAMWGIALLLIVQQLENSIIAPKIVGESVGLNPVVVIIGLIIGAGYFGVIGMILAIPTLCILKIISSFLLDKVSEK